jgi:hypothetical protein
MNSSRLRLAVAILTFGASLFGGALADAPRVEGAARHYEPAQVVPLDMIAPEHRDSVAEVITAHTFHRQGSPDTFPCHPKIYLSLLNEPALTLALWQDLSTSPAKLRQVGPDRYQGTDGTGTSATWEFVYRSPRVNVLLCNLDYVGPHGNVRLNGRIVLIVHTEYIQKSATDPWVRHEVELFVKIDSKGWRAVAKTARPLIEKLLEDQVQEAGWFVSLMGRLVELYPNWACQVAQQGADIRPDVRQSFTALILQNRRPGAFTGRPALAENEAPSPPSRMR